MFDLLVFIAVILSFTSFRGLSACCPLTPFNFPVVPETMSFSKEYILSKEMAYARWINANGSSPRNGCQSTVKVSHDQQPRSAIYDLLYYYSRVTYDVASISGITAGKIG